jgi:hypothetical protein
VRAKYPDRDRVDADRGLEYDAIIEPRITGAVL